MSALRFTLLVGVSLAVGYVELLAQTPHQHHHQDDELAFESATDPSLWGGIDSTLRAEFDSAYTSVMRDPEALDQLYRSHLSRIPAKAMLQFLSEKHDYCHIAAHFLGQAVYSYYGSLGIAVYECGEGCSSACMHGAVREAFSGATVDAVVASVDSVCSLDGMAETNRPGNCAHALGHALMMVTGDSLRASLDGCARFPGVSLPHYCATGVFMEYGAAQRYRDPGPKDGELVSRYPCDVLGDFAAACYRYVVPRMRHFLRTADPTVLASECRRLPRMEQLGCFRGLGIAFGGTVRQSPAKIHEVCADSDYHNVLVCIDALVEQVSYLKPQGTESLICDELEGKAHDVCTAALTGRYELYKPIMDIYLGQGK